MIAGIWAKFSKWIIGAAAALAAVLAIYFKGRSAGKQVEQEKATKRDVEEAKEHAQTVREATDVQTNVIRMPDSAVREQLRRKWTR
jgi:stringent starvation protein B